MYCDQFVCLPVCLCVCVCLSASISLKPLDRSSRNFCADLLWPWLGLLWQRCDTLCSSGFMDDVTFGRNGRDVETWRLHRAATAMSGVAIPGRSLAFMNACYVLLTTRFNNTAIHFYLLIYIILVYSPSFSGPAFFSRPNGRTCIHTSGRRAVSHQLRTSTDLSLWV